MSELAFLFQKLRNGFVLKLLSGVCSNYRRNVIFVRPLWAHHNGQGDLFLRKQRGQSVQRLRTI